MHTSISGLHILIVEDEPLLAWELELVFAGAGAVVVGPASTLEAGCKLAKQNDLAAAVLDLRLGDEETWPLAALLHENGVPFIIHTGHGTPASMAWTSVPVVRKPANPEEIVELISTLVLRRGNEVSPLLTAARHA